MLSLLLLLSITGWVVKGEPERNCPGLVRLKDRFSSSHTIGGMGIHQRCSVLDKCEGIQCDGKLGNTPVAFTLKMKHCESPVSIQMIVSKPHPKEITLVDGQRIDVFSLRTMKVSVTPDLKRVGNQVNIKLHICFVVAGVCLHKWPVNTTITVNKEVCHEDTTNPSGKVTPVTLSTKQPPNSKMAPSSRITPSVSHGSTGVSTQRSVKPITQVMGPTTRRAQGSTGKGRHSTGTRMYTTKKRMYSTGSMVHTTKSGGYTGGTRRPHTTGKHHGKGSSSGLSTGGKVAVISSAVLIFVVLVGLFVYCRRLKSRKPAFYNDIAINDPLRGEMYEGDDEPLFNSHLVL